MKPRDADKASHLRFQDILEALPGLRERFLSDLGVVSAGRDATSPLLRAPIPSPRAQGREIVASHKAIYGDSPKSGPSLVDFARAVRRLHAWLAFQDERRFVERVLDRNVLEERPEMAVAGAADRLVLQRLEEARSLAGDERLTIPEALALTTPFAIARLEAATGGGIVDWLRGAPVAASASERSSTSSGSLLLCHAGIGALVMQERLPAEREEAQVIAAWMLFETRHRGPIEELARSTAPASAAALAFALGGGADVPDRLLPHVERILAEHGLAAGPLVCAVDERTVGLDVLVKARRALQLLTPKRERDL